MKKISVILLAFSIIFSMISCANVIYAETGDSLFDQRYNYPWNDPQENTTPWLNQGGTENTNETDESEGDFWNQANEWYDKGKNEYSEDGKTIDNLAEKNSNVREIINELSKMVNIIGTTVIVCVTTFLGIKYIFGSVESKTEVKESLLTLVVACVFFFGWNGIWGTIFQNGTLVFNNANDGYESVIGSIFKTVSLIANILAILGVIYIGIRYIFAGAEGKAELKGKSTHFLIGVILAFCSVGILNYISAVVNEIFTP